MKLKFVGGSTTKISLVDGRRVTQEIEATEVTQLFEDAEYHWPQVGAVLQVPDNVGAWLKGKLGKLLELVPDEERDRPKAAPRRFTAQMPREKHEPVAAAPAKPTR